MVRSVGGLAIATAAVAGAASAALAQAKPLAGEAAPVARFAHLPVGWHQYPDPPDALALSWRYRANTFGWAASMPRGGIAAYVHFLPGKAHFRPLRLVLPRRPVTLLEGTRDTPEYRIYGRVEGADLIIFVDIRRLHPTHAQLAAARRVVSLTRFSLGPLGGHSGTGPSERSVT
jgi:hypothetical protein